MFFKFLYFLLLAFLTFYLPGRYLLRLSTRNDKNFSIRVFLSLSLGISLFLLSTYILSWIKLERLYLLPLFIILFLEGKKSLNELRKNINLQRCFSFEVILITVGSVAMSYLTWRSGLLVKGNIEFYGVNAVDSFYHLGLIGSLTHYFPPVHPGAAFIPLRGYHFFYDFLIANFVKFYNLDIFDSFFRYFPFFTALLYGMASLALARFFKMNKVTTLTFLYLMYFAQGFDFFLFGLFNLPGGFNNSAGVTQSLVNIIDPSVVLSVAISFAAVILMFTGKKTANFLLASLCLGLLPQLKIYTAIIFFGSLVLLSLGAFFRSKDTYFIKILLLSGFIAGVVYLPINFGAGHLIFSPLLLYRHYMDSVPLLNSLHFSLKYEIYLNAHNYLRVASLYFLTIGLFFLSSLGLRIATALFFKKILNYKFYSSPNIFWLSAIFISFIIPTLFIQTTSVFSSIQFLWIGYILLILPTSFSLATFMRKANKFKIMIYVIFLLLVSLPETVNLLREYSRPALLIDEDLATVSLKIKSLARPEEGILVLNVDRDDKGELVPAYGIPLVSSLTSYPVFYEPEVTAFSDLNWEIEKRKNYIYNIQQAIDSCDSYELTNQKIYADMNEVKNNFILTLEENPCLDKLTNFKKVSRAGQLSVYELD